MNPLLPFRRGLQALRHRHRGCWIPFVGALLLIVLVVSAFVRSISTPSLSSIGNYRRLDAESGAATEAASTARSSDAIAVHKASLLAASEEASLSFGRCGPAGRVEVAVAVDADAVDVIGPLMQSAQVNSVKPHCLRFQIIVPESSAAQLAEAIWQVLVFHRLVDESPWVPQKTIHASSTASLSESDAVMPIIARFQLNGGSAVRIIPFDSALVAGSMKVVGAGAASASVCRGLEGCDPSRARRLAKATNFARFFLARLLPDLNKVMWVDCDVLFQKDPRTLWQVALGQGHGDDSETFVAAFVEHVPLGRFYFNQDNVQSLWTQRYQRNLDMSADSFNDGAIVIDLSKWRKFRVTEDVQWWMQKHKEADPALWKFGTQPIMLLVVGARWQQLPSEWYLGDLGFKRIEDFDRESLQQASEAVVAHFDGEHKPWLPESVSEVNLQRHGLRIGYNSQVLRPYTPLSSPVAWLAAPGARCLFSSSAQSAPCEVGPLTPGVSVPGLRWVSSEDLFLGVASISASSSHAADVSGLFVPQVRKNLPLVDSFVEGFFSAAPLEKRAKNVLESSVFSRSAERVIELFFFKPRRLAELYMQAASPDHSIRGAQLQYRIGVDAQDVWRDACELRRATVCEPRRGPSFAAGTSEACWLLSGCGMVEAQNWRIVGWSVEAQEQALGNVWFTVARPARAAPLII